jgi:hypothetical protein
MGVIAIENDYLLLFTEIAPADKPGLKPGLFKVRL